MNVNLGYTGSFDTSQEEIEEHQEILKGTGINIIGLPVLIPEGPNYPGSYRVWSPVEHEDEEGTIWVYVDPDGVALWRTTAGLVDA